ncbi:MAG: 3D domain-containing protein [Lachnospiraceae bacterium]
MKKKVFIWMLLLSLALTSIPTYSTAAPKVKLNKKITSLLKKSESVKNLGTYTATFYCTNHCCNGGYTGTALGTKLKPERTIAVDKRYIPLGSSVIIKYPNGQVKRYIAEDTGSAIKGKRIDICVASHSLALKKGRQSIQVYVIQK